MTVVAILMVKDEADVIGPILDHLLLSVDEVVVSDNGSTDGTREIAESKPVTVLTDKVVGYWQSRKMSYLARDAYTRGHSWVVPCDADEVWYAPDGRTLADYLSGLAPDVTICSADLFNHVPTGDDPVEGDPVQRLGWRLRSRGSLPKVAARLSDQVVIAAGNHAASGVGKGMKVPGLQIQHFSWRSEEQYLRKIRNGREAYAATELPKDTGAHWRMFEGVGDEEIREHFRQWFYFATPQLADTLIFDPAPIRRPAAALESADT